jgi:quercetin dioxygenase-like cupin family protein
MSDLVDIGTLNPFEIWGEAVRARKIEGRNITLAVVELAPGATVPSHQHFQEQLGICITGTVTFTVGEETRELGPGGTWRAHSNVPHGVTAGPEGAVVMDVFAPIRDDWAFPPLEPRPTVWPQQD